MASTVLSEFSRQRLGVHLELLRGHGCGIGERPVDPGGSSASTGRRISRGFALTVSHLPSSYRAGLADKVFAGDVTRGGSARWTRYQGALWTRDGMVQGVARAAHGKARR